MPAYAKFWYGQVASATAVLTEVHGTLGEGQRSSAWAAGTTNQPQETESPRPCQHEGVSVYV